MNKTLKLINFVGLALLLVVTLSIVTYFSTNQKAFGSVNTNEGYYSTTTNSTFASTQRVLRAGGGIFGSVVVASSSPGVFKIWNATSTIDTGSSTLVIFSPSPANGTYTFDAVFDRGIVVETPSGYFGSYVVTWK